MSVPVPGNGSVVLLGDHRDNSGNLNPQQVLITGGALAVTQPAGARNPSSAVTGYLDVRTASPDPRVLSGTTAISVAAGVIGQAGGVANDTQLMQVILLKNAGPATLTIAGFKDQTGTPQNILLSGSSTTDTIYNFDGLQNSAGAMTLTPSVTLTAIVSVRPS